MCTLLSGRGGCCLHKVRGLVVGTSNSNDDLERWIRSRFVFIQSTNDEDCRFKFHE